MQSQMRNKQVTSAAGAGCKLCKAPIAAGFVAQCHAACLSFACPGCVANNNDSFNLMNLKNHIFDYHCQACITHAFELQTKARPRIIERHTAPVL